MPKKKQIKACGYIRVSSTEQAEHGASLKAQEEEIRKYAEYKGWKLTKIYADRGISGHKAEKRPGFLEMVKAAQDGLVEVVVVTYLSRFARNMRELLEYVQVLADHKVAMVSLRENIDGSAGATGKLMLHIMAALAEFERELMMERIATGKAVKLANRTMWSGKAPYGYTWDKAKCEFVFNEEEAQIYRRIVDLYLNHGMAMKKIAYQLNEEGIRGRHSRQLSSGVIAGILRNTAYYGELYANRHVYKDGKRTGELKPRSQWVKYETPPLIDRLTWDRIQERSKQNKVGVKRLYDREAYWLRDLVECGECGGRVQPHHGAKRKDGSYPRYYSCFWSGQSPAKLKLEGRKGKCPLPLIRAKELEAAVWNNVVNKLALAGNRPKRLKQLLEGEQYGKRLKQAEAKRDSLDKQRAAKERAKRNLLAMLERDLTESLIEDLHTQLQANSDELASLDQKLALADADLLEAQAAKENAEQYLAFMRDNKDALADLAQQLAALPPEGKRTLVMAMLNGKKIKVTGERKPKKSGPSGWGVEPHSYPGYFDHGVLGALKEQGLLDVLCQYGPLYPAAHDL